MAQMQETRPASKITRTNTTYTCRSRGRGWDDGEEFVRIPCYVFQQRGTEKIGFNIWSWQWKSWPAVTQQNPMRDGICRVVGAFSRFLHVIGTLSGKSTWYGSIRVKPFNREPMRIVVAGNFFWTIYYDIFFLLLPTGSGKSKIFAKKITHNGLHGLKKKFGTFVLNAYPSWGFGPGFPHRFSGLGESYPNNCGSFTMYWSWFVW